MEGGLSTKERAKRDQSPPGLTGVTVHEESAPVGDERIRAGCIRSGDIRAVILQTRAGAAAAVPPHQAVIFRSSCCADPAGPT